MSEQPGVFATFRDTSSADRRDLRAEDLGAALPEHYASSTPLPAGEPQEAQCLARALRSGSGDGEQVYRLSELGVASVALNPMPLPLGKVNYER
ncbi:hypothetical protein [Rhodococcus tukisamuensis]|uniref:hypothetical protein n=1 Tax=Rhodococcus tukisamuensis TaxID=168276 RepID=UPI00111412EF|nr:hypothetical protein [Rhodococcus tukisamuensis]